MVLKKLFPVVILLIGLVLFFALDLSKLLSFSALQTHHQELSKWVNDAGSLSYITYIIAYIVVVAFSLPGGVVMTVTGGFLFGPYLGTLCSVTGASIGATVLYVLARGILGESLVHRVGPWLEKLKEGFNKNALSYLLMLRLVPIFPFWLVNLAPAFLGVDLKTFILATTLGIIPGGFVFSLFGAGLGQVFESGEAVSLQGVLSPEMLGGLLGLGLLSLIPILYQRLQKEA